MGFRWWPGCISLSLSGGLAVLCGNKRSLRNRALGRSSRVHQTTSFLLPVGTGWCLCWAPSTRRADLCALPRIKGRCVCAWHPWQPGQLIASESFVPTLQSARFETLSLEPATKNTHLSIIVLMLNHSIKFWRAGRRLADCVTAVPSLQLLRLGGRGLVRCECSLQSNEPGWGAFWVTLVVWWRWTRKYGVWAYVWPKLRTLPCFPCSYCSCHVSQSSCLVSRHGVAPHQKKLKIKLEVRLQIKLGLLKWSRDSAMPWARLPRAPVGTFPWCTHLPSEERAKHAYCRRSWDTGNLSFLFLGVFFRFSVMWFSRAYTKKRMSRRD